MSTLTFQHFFLYIIKAIITVPSENYMVLRHITWLIFVRGSNTNVSAFCLAKQTERLGSTCLLFRLTSA